MNRIKAIRTELGLTVRKLAKESGVAASYISTLENDESGTSNPTKDVMYKIATALKSTVPEVFFCK